MPEQSAVTVAHLLGTEVIPRSGVPMQIHTDQEGNFKSVPFKEMCRLPDIAKTRTTPLHAPTIRWNGGTPKSYIWRLRYPNLSK